MLQGNLRDVAETHNIFTNPGWDQQWFCKEYGRTESLANADSHKLNVQTSFVAARHS
jgi:hypothetical protein